MSYYGECIAAFRTLTAPRWKVWLARVFGTRSESRDGNMLVVCHTWRGVQYLTDYRET